LELEANTARQSLLAQTAPILDLDAHTYPQIKSFWKRDENWVEGAVDDDGYDVSSLKWPAGKKSYKWKGWEFSKTLEGV
jgi:hypothetical protein